MTENRQNELEALVDMWLRHVLSARDASLAIERLFADGLAIDQFFLLPEELRRQILHDLDVFASEGRRLVWIAGSSHNEPLDESETMRKVSSAFASAKVWSP